MPLPMPQFLMPQAMPAYLADLNASLHGFERFAEPERLVENLPRGKSFAWFENVTIAHVVRVDAHFFRESIEQVLDRERRLVRAEPTHRPARRIIRVDGERLHIDRGHSVRPGAMAARALQHFCADRRIRALIANDARLERP